jgi:hypothetical protein
LAHIQSGTKSDKPKEEVMAIVQSVDGKFFEVPDDKLEKYAVPADKVKDLLKQAGVGPTAKGGPQGGPQGGPGGAKGGGASPQVVIHVSGSGTSIGGPQKGAPGGPQGQQGEGSDEEGVQPHGYWWANWWSNCWSNCWANCWRNCY